MRNRSFEDYLAEQMKDPEFRAEWDALEPEFAALNAELDAREKTESGIKAVKILPYERVSL